MYQLQRFNHKGTYDDGTSYTTLEAAQKEAKQLIKTAIEFDMHNIDGVKLEYSIRKNGQHLKTVTWEPKVVTSK